MGKFSLMEKVCILISAALVLMCSAAERDYVFHDWRNLTWDEARSYCQVCFKELVTLTPGNIQTISQTLTSDCWVGLRKNSNSSNSSMSWSRWANGEPLTFQNWYPGRPVLNSSFPRRGCCSCSATVATPTMTSVTGFRETTTANASFLNTTDHTVTGQPATDYTATGQPATDYTVTGQPATDYIVMHQPATGHTVTGHPATGHTVTGEPATGHTVTGEPATGHTVTGQPATGHTVTGQPATGQPATAQPATGQPGYEDCDETNENYIEDSCVAMLSFGAWVEKNCSERLSFICYEDPFIAKINVTEITSEGATLTWLKGPGNISKYRVAVRADENVTQFQTENLTYDLVDLTAGTRYSAQVIPVKCDRNLKPEETLFHTIPNKVENLRVTKVTETSLFLSWSKPAGNVDVYLVEDQDGRQNRSKMESKEIDGLSPGNLYTLTVRSEVGDGPTWSKKSNVSAYTKPGKVSNLMVSNNTAECLLLQWEPPEGNTTGFSVKATDVNNHIYFNSTVNQTQEKVTGLPRGTEIVFNVTALTDSNALEGDVVTITNYTAPGAISNLSLSSSHNTVNATWSLPNGHFSSYSVTLQLSGEKTPTVYDVTQPRKEFEGLKTAANYTVVVHAVSGNLSGPSEQRSIFTEPSKPTDATATSVNKDSITFQWKAPDNAATAKYYVNINSSFWNQSWSYNTAENQTSYTFAGLKSGTRYDFEVRTISDGKHSDPALASSFTAAEKREISLSMLCSSAEPLLCDNDSTRANVFDQLHKHFNNLLGNSVIWSLEKQESEYKGT